MVCRVEYFAQQLQRVFALKRDVLLSACIGHDHLPQFVRIRVVFQLRFTAMSGLRALIYYSAPWCNSLACRLDTDDECLLTKREFE